MCCLLFGIKIQCDQQLKTNFQAFIYIKNEINECATVASSQIFFFLVHSFTLYWDVMSWLSFHSNLKKELQNYRIKSFLLFFGCWRKRHVTVIQMSDTWLAAFFFHGENNKFSFLLFRLCLSDKEKLTELV